MIDPTCGSGHFLLGAFDRLLDHWYKYAPGMEVQARVQTALDAIHGVDINPFAVAIARFRLTVAALTACHLRSLEDAPAFKLQLAVGDSLIHGPDANVIPGLESRSAFMPFHYTTEDAQLLLEILQEGQYDAVVGNPPYIQPQDQALNRIYRAKFDGLCKGVYALTVPFVAEFFALAKTGDQSGLIGMITSNSFMKRKFGANLIEKFFPKVDLQLVIDSEGAWIPGHNTDGTPTVILVGRNQSPLAPTVRSVLGKGKRETRASGDNGDGPIWTAIVNHWNEPGWDDPWISVVDIPRDLLASHPWSLSGGSARQILQLIDAAPLRLGSQVSRIGFMAMSHADEAFIVPEDFIDRMRFTEENWPLMISGSSVRNYTAESDERIYFPYNEDRFLIPLSRNSREWKFLWPLRASLEGRATFGGGTYRSEHRPWHAWHQVPADKAASPLSIAYAEVATHNHFTLDRGGRVFKQTAPIIKLSLSKLEDDHFPLLGVLNSSVACFWLKQSSQPKGGSAEISWLRTYQLSGTLLQKYPLPYELPKFRVQILDRLARELIAHEPNAVCIREVPTARKLDTARKASGDIIRRMISLQEESDWEFYFHYGLIDSDLTCKDIEPPPLNLGERAFEILLAQSEDESDATWFIEQGIAPTPEIPEHWPESYQQLVRERLRLIAQHPYFQLLERPEYKRRWEQVDWDKREQRALQHWLLRRLEDRRLWFDQQGRPQPNSVAQLSDRVTRDQEITSVLALWEKRPDVPVTDSLKRLIADESVPFHAGYRYNESGLRKRVAWESTWALQRREDSGDLVDIETPPKYASADFQRPAYARLRGELDVPKERFILYPDASRDGDGTPLLGWAGWDHAEQALALASVIHDREQEGWPDERLVPLIAGLAELQPWVDQWHGEVHPLYGVSLAAFCAEELARRAAQVSMTIEELRWWRPEKKGRGRGKA
jgi:hypothetical protein